MAKILEKRLSQGERGVVGVFDQALTRLSGFFVAAITERALMPLPIVLRAGLSGAQATYRVQSLVSISLVRKAPRPIDPGPRHRSCSALCSWFASHTGVFGARGFCPVVFPPVWLPEDPRLGGGISPGATVVENGDL